MINEYDSYKEDIGRRSLLDNARIAYRKGLELYPESGVLRRAVEDLEDDPLPPENTRLVHVVGGRGFAPVKKTLEFSIRAGNVRVPFRLPKYTLVPTRVQKLTVTTVDGSTIRELSTLASVEALALRYQKDGAPERVLDVTVGLVRNFFENQTLRRLGTAGEMIQDLRSEMKTPDTRSWSSLPKDLMAARLHLDRDVKKIRIVATGEEGQVLAAKTVDVNDRHPDFVYVRALDDFLHVANSQTLWMETYQ